MKKTTIYIVRHGESLGNATKTMLGHTNLDLSEHGYKQAEATCKHLASVHFDKIYSSDLLRAFNTAKPHADLRGLEVIPKVGLRELNVGAWEGKHVSEIIQNYGDMFEVHWHGGFGTFTFPDGEAVMGAAQRFYNAVLKIAREDMGKTVLIGAHAGVIRGFWSIISGVAPEDIVEKIDWPTNASYSICEFDGEKLIPLEYSNDEHLAEIGITRVINKQDKK